MRSVTFPYVTHKRIKIPSIPLGLKISGEWRKFWAFVDSGATFSIFKAEEVESFPWQRGELKHVQVGDGSFIPVYLHRLPLRLGNFEIKATVGFSARLGVEFNLLGRAGVFTDFDVTFSDSRQKVIFKKV